MPGRRDRRRKLKKRIERRRELGITKTKTTRKPDGVPAGVLIDTVRDSQRAYVRAVLSRRRYAGTNHEVLMDAVEDADHAARFERLLDHVSTMSPRLANATFQPWLWTVARFEPLRPVEAWTPRSRSPYRQQRTLIEHLLVRYRVPEFLYQPFTATAVGVRPRAVIRCPTAERFIDLFAYLTHGGSLKEAIDEGRFPVPLT